MGVVSLHGSLLLMAFFLHNALTAPVIDDNTALLGPDQLAEGKGCYYNYENYEEGDRIITNEPCLNCTCHNRMLMCYLRVCPFTKAIGQDCKVEKRPDQCCPIITCPQVPVTLLTSSTTETTSTTTALGHPDNYGCNLDDNTFYPDGAQVPSDLKKPCELCYCIRNQTACVMQECTLHVEGCKPVYQEGVCCPVRYNCDYEDILTTPQPTIGLVTTPGGPNECQINGTIYRDGELITNMTDNACEHCYCMRGDLVCAVQECGSPLENTECTPMPTEAGQCCPSTYQCPNGTIPVNDTHRKPTPAPENFSATENPSNVEPNKVEDDQAGVKNNGNTDITSENLQILEIITTLSPIESDEIPPHSDDSIQTGSTSEVAYGTSESEGAVDHETDSENASSPPGVFTEISVENVEVNTSQTEKNHASAVHDVETSPVEETSSPPSTANVEENHHDISEGLLKPTYSGASDNEEPEKQETSDQSTDMPSKQIVEEKPDTTPATISNSVATELARIPGEGSCLHKGVTYPSNAEISSGDPCKRCKCQNSIVLCHDFECPEPPISAESNCVPMPPTDDACCPTYLCEQKPSQEPEAENQVSIDKIDESVPDEDETPEGVIQPIPLSPTSNEYPIPSMDGIPENLVPGTDEIHLTPGMEDNIAHPVPSEVHNILDVVPQDTGDSSQQGGITTAQPDVAVDHHVSSASEQEHLNEDGITPSTEHIETNEAIDEVSEGAVVQEETVNHPDVSKPTSSVDDESQTTQKADVLSEEVQTEVPHNEESHQPEADSDNKQTPENDSEDTHEEQSQTNIGSTMDEHVSILPGHEEINADTSASSDLSGHLEQDHTGSTEIHTEPASLEVENSTSNPVEADSEPQQVENVETHSDLSSPTSDAITESNEQLTGVETTPQESETITEHPSTVPAGNPELESIITEGPIVVPLNQQSELNIPGPEGIIPDERLGSTIVPTQFGVNQTEQPTNDSTENESVHDGVGSSTEDLTPVSAYSANEGDTNVSSQTNEILPFQDSNPNVQQPEQITEKGSSSLSTETSVSADDHQSSVEPQDTSETIESHVHEETQHPVTFDPQTEASLLPVVTHGDLPLANEQDTTTNELKEPENTDETESPYTVHQDEESHEPESHNITPIPDDSGEVVTQVEDLKPPQAPEVGNQVIEADESEVAHTVDHNQLDENEEGVKETTHDDIIDSLPPAEVHTLEATEQESSESEPSNIGQPKEPSTNYGHTSESQHASEHQELPESQLAEVQPTNPLENHPEETLAEPSGPSDINPNEISESQKSDSETQTADLELSQLSEHQIEGMELPQQLAESPTPENLPEVQSAPSVEEHAASPEVPSAPSDQKPESQSSYASEHHTESPESQPSEPSYHHTESPESHLSESLEHHTDSPEPQSSGSSEHHKESPESQSSESSEHHTEFPESQSFESSEHHNESPESQSSDFSGHHTESPELQSSESSEHHSQSHESQTPESLDVQTEAVPVSQSSESSEHQSEASPASLSSESTEYQTEAVPESQSSNSSEQQSETSDLHVPQSLGTQTEGTPETSNYEPEEQPESQTPDSIEHQPEVSIESHPNETPSQKLPELQPIVASVDNVEPPSDSQLPVSNEAQPDEPGVELPTGPTEAETDETGVLQSEDLIAPQPEPSVPNPDEPSTPQPEDASASKPEEPSAPLPDESSTPHPEEPSPPQPEEPSAPQPEEPSVPQPEESSAPQSEEPSTSQPDESSSPQSEEPSVPLPAEPSTSQTEEGSSAPQPEEPSAPQPVPSVPQGEDVIVPQSEDKDAPQSEGPAMPQTEQPEESQPENNSASHPDEPIGQAGESPVTPAQDITDSHPTEPSRTQTDELSPLETHDNVEFRPEGLPDSFPEEHPLLTTEHTIAETFEDDQLPELLPGHPIVAKPGGMFGSQPEEPSVLDGGEPVLVNSEASASPSGDHIEALPEEPSISQSETELPKPEDLLTENVEPDITHLISNQISEDASPALPGNELIDDNAVPIATTVVPEQEKAETSSEEELPVSPTQEQTTNESDHSQPSEEIVSGQAEPSGSHEGAIPNDHIVQESIQEDSHSEPSVSLSSDSSVVPPSQESNGVNSVQEVVTEPHDPPVVGEQEHTELNEILNEAEQNKPIVSEGENVATEVEETNEKNQDVSQSNGEMPVGQEKDHSTEANLVEPVEKVPETEPALIVTPEEPENGHKSPELHSGAISEATVAMQTENEESQPISTSTDEKVAPETSLPAQSEQSSHVETESTSQSFPPSSSFSGSSPLPMVEVPSTEGPLVPSSLSPWTPKPNLPTPDHPHHPTDLPHPEEAHYPSQPYDSDYDEEDTVSYGPGTCRYAGKVYLSAQQIPRDDPCDFCFCFRSDILCLQQSCPPPIRGCRQETIKGFCCPRYACHVSMATVVNITTTSTTTTTTVPPHFLTHHYNGSAVRSGCHVRGVSYRVGDKIPTASGPCQDCRCGADGLMKCDPTHCAPHESILSQVIAASSNKRRRR